MRIFKDNKELINAAFKELPTLIIDCANMMNPHDLYPELPLEDFEKVLVLEVEMLYKFKQIIDNIQDYIDSYGIKTLAIPMGGLFNYDNQEENLSIYKKVLYKLESLNINVFIHWSLAHEVYNSKNYSEYDGAYSNESEKNYRNDNSRIERLLKSTQT